MFFKDKLYRSALDITLCTPDLSILAEWQIIDEFIGTDHLPIITTIREAPFNSKCTKYRVDHDEAVKFIKEIKVEHTFDIDDLLSEINGKVKKATHIDKFNDKKRTPKAWWNEKIKILWLIKKSKQKVHNKFKTLYTAVELKKATSTLKAIIKAKKDSWSKFIDNISPNMNSAEILKRIKCINGRTLRQQSSIINNKENIDKFLSLNFKTNRSIRIKSGIVLSPEFKVEEILKKIKDSRNTAPGHDEISIKLLKEFPIGHIEILTKHLNDMWYQK